MISVKSRVLHKKSLIAEKLLLTNDRSCAEKSTKLNKSDLSATKLFLSHRSFVHFCSGHNGVLHCSQKDLELIDTFSKPTILCSW